MGVVRRRGREHHFEFMWARPHLPPQVHGEKSASHYLALQAWRQPIALGQPRRKMGVVIVVPAAGCRVAIMIGIAVMVVFFVDSSTVVLAAIAMVVAVTVFVIGVVFLVTAAVLVVLGNGDCG